MPKQIRLRRLSAEEEQEIRRLARARKEGVELVRRARLIEYVLDHPEVPASRAGMRVIRNWLKKRWRCTTTDCSAGYVAYRRRRRENAQLSIAKHEVLSGIRTDRSIVWS
jgi:hypothetical protein